MKYKVGDKVRIINNKKGYDHRAKYIGQTVTVKRANPNGERVYDEPHYSVKEGIPFVFFESELAPVNSQKIVITSDGTETLARLYDGNKVIKSATAKCSPADAFDFNTGAKVAFERLIGEEKKEQEWRVVNRPARKGDYVRIVEPLFSFNEIGDILKVESLHGTCIFVRGSDHPRDTGDDKFGWCYCAHHFEVVEPCKKPETPKYYNGKVVCVELGYEESIPLRVFTVGKVYTVTDGILLADGGYKTERYKSLEDLCTGVGCKLIPFVE